MIELHFSTKISKDTGTGLTNYTLPTSEPPVSVNEAALKHSDRMMADFLVVKKLVGL